MKQHSTSSWKIFIGLLVGASLGLGFHYLREDPSYLRLLDLLIQPVGIAFLRALFMLVVPLVMSSLIVGVYQLGNGKYVAHMGWRLAAYYVATTLIAVMFGQLLVALIRPGDGIPIDIVESARLAMKGQVADLTSKSTSVMSSVWPGIIQAIIPKNIVSSMVGTEMLAIIFFSILLGLALLGVEKQKSIVLISGLEALSQACVIMIQWVMKTAPFAVGALICNSVARMGPEVMLQMSKFVFVVLFGYAVHFVFTYGSLLRFVLRVPVFEFIRKVSPVLVTAFGTSSSNATIPTTMKTLEEEFEVPKSITSFSVPLGATVNMDGTALFEVVAAIFVAQVFHIELGLMGHLSLVLMVLFTSIGVAGVPGGSIPILISLMSMNGIPPEGIALILGVDRILDMGRTVVNVTGDMVGAMLLSKPFSAVGNPLKTAP